MTDNPSSEIVHCLFMDVVGSSALSIDDQSRLIGRLFAMVRNTREHQRAVGDSGFLSLDRGDGIALVFSRDLASPVRCAIEIALKIRDHPDLQLRMGVHSGPAKRTVGNGRPENVDGDGIVIARRVMEAAQPGQILVSGRMAMDLSKFDEWAENFLDLGIVTDRHHNELHVYCLVVPGKDTAYIPQVSKEHSAHAIDVSTDPTSMGPPPSGGLPVNHPCYVTRHLDNEFTAAILRRDSIVLLKGARQMGKTSLLARGIQRAREEGARVALIDFQTFGSEDMISSETFFLAVARAVKLQLDLDVSVRRTWDEDLSPSQNMESFLRRQVLNKISEPVVWALDEVDRLFASSFGGDIFGLFRSWHNRRALDPNGPWSRFTLAMAYATEAHLFISDLNQSPFNGGTRLALQDFNLAQTEELNQRYEGPLIGSSELHRFQSLFHGQPYLTHFALYEMEVRGMSLPELELQADRDVGPFGDHLRRLLVCLKRDPVMVSAMREVLAGRPCPSSEAFYRLQEGGAVSGESMHDAKPRCRLYERYLGKNLA